MNALSPAAPHPSLVVTKTAPVNTAKPAASPATTGTQVPKPVPNNAITSVVCHLARLTPNVIMKAVLKNIASNIVQAIMKKATENVFVLPTTTKIPVLLTVYVTPVMENIKYLIAIPQLTVMKTVSAKEKAVAEKAQFIIPTDSAIR